MKFALGGEEYERIEVDVAGYEREPVGQFYDDNWLPVTVSVTVGRFVGQFSAEFMSDDFLDKKENESDQLAKIYSYDGKVIKQFNDCWMVTYSFGFASIHAKQFEYTTNMPICKE